MQYRPGDHLAVYPANNDKTVEELLAKCDDTIDIDEVMEFQKDVGGRRML